MLKTIFSSQVELEVDYECNADSTRSYENISFSDCDVIICMFENNYRRSNVTVRALKSHDKTSSMGLGNQASCMFQGKSMSVIK